MNKNVNLVLLREFQPQPRKPGSGHSPTDQATALAQPSFLNMNTNICTTLLPVFNTTISGTML
jgi:hypothetical protein